MYIFIGVQRSPCHPDSLSRQMPTPSRTQRRAHPRTPLSPHQRAKWTRTRTRSRATLSFLVHRLLGCHEVAYMGARARRRPLLFCTTISRRLLSPYLSCRPRPIARPRTTVMFCCVPDYSISTSTARFIVPSAFVLSIQVYTGAWFLDL